jgi:cobalt-zinc-cadmium efflux system membrane fusion protein
VKKFMATGWALPLAVVILAGCGKPESATSPREPAPESNALAGAAVILTGSQTNAIRIAPLGTYLFRIEEAAVGNVSFAEDAAVVQAESTLVSAAATFTATGKELARVIALGETNGIAPKEFEQATADHQSAEASLEGAKHALRVLGVGDGEIDEMVAAVKIQFAPAGRHWVSANISESECSLLRTGQVVQVRVKAFPGRSFDGEVSKIYVTVDPNIHRQLIRCAVQDPGDELRPGMFADISIRLKEPVAAAAIPANGVVRESDGTMTAWVTTDGHKFLQRKLKLGLLTDGFYQVLEGLKPGELIVTEGAVFLSNILDAPPSDD